MKPFQPTLSLQNERTWPGLSRPAAGWPRRATVTFSRAAANQNRPVRAHSAPTDAHYCAFRNIYDALALFGVDLVVPLMCTLGGPHFPPSLGTEV